MGTHSDAISMVLSSMSSSPAGWLGGSRDAGCPSGTCTAAPVPSREVAGRAPKDEATPPTQGTSASDRCIGVIDAMPEEGAPGAYR